MMSCGGDHTENKKNSPLKRLANILRVMKRPITAIDSEFQTRDKQPYGPRGYDSPCRRQVTPKSQAPVIIRQFVVDAVSFAIHVGSLTLHSRRQTEFSDAASCFPQKESRCSGLTCVKILSLYMHFSADRNQRRKHAMDKPILIFT